MTALPQEPISGSAEWTPVVPGFYPDPTVCRVGEAYYMAHSSFEYFPAAPLFHSTDLVSWTQIANIITRTQQANLVGSRPSTGIYGSTLRHHAGRFYFITTNVSDYDGGQVLLQADDPRGPWSDALRIPQAVGIDPDLCWDQEGTCYLTWHALDFATGEQSIRQAPLDTVTGLLTADHYPVWQGSGLPAAEGPHLYHIEDTWYLLLAEGGTERGHCVTVARAPHPSGPFQACPGNPVFTRRSSVHPVQSVGHADLVQRPDGEWAAVYLGTRPRGSTPGHHVLGRETFLAGITWQDGWPEFDVSRYAAAPVTTFEDDFSDGELDVRWVSPGQDPAALVESTAGTGLRLRPGDAGLPQLLCARVRDLVWRFEVAVSGPVTVRLQIDDRHWCGLSVLGGEVHAEVQVGDIRHRLRSITVAGGSSSDGTVLLGLSAVTPSDSAVPLGRAGPDEVVMSVGGSDLWVELARLDGRYFSTEVASGFTGRVLGVGAVGSDARVLSVSYRSLQEGAQEQPRG